MKIFFIFIFFAIVALNAQTLTLGVFAYRTPEKIMQEYKPIAEHLGRELNVSVIVKSLSQEDLEKELFEEKIDFIVTNPTHYLSLKKQGKTTGAIATLVKRYNNVITPYLGGVIITRADRADMRTIFDLAGKTIAIPNNKMLGGYQTQAYELSKVGLDITKDLKTVAYKTHEATVAAVLLKKADAGFIRSGILEEMIAENKLNPQDFFIINEQKSPNFPMKISTELYSEWTIVAAKKLDLDTVSKAAVALYGYKDTQIGNDIISAFTIAGEYDNIDTLARSLRIPPYNFIPPFTYEDILSKHRNAIVIIVSLTTLFFLVLSFLYRRTRFEKQYAQSILDVIPTPIIVTDGKMLISANRAFLNFVEYKTTEAFRIQHNCICELFEEGETKEYLHTDMNEKTWIEYIVANPEQEHKAKITIHGITRFFKVDVSVVKYKDLFRAIAFFDDISQLVNQSTTDVLTRIANRTHFNLLFEYSVSIALREKTPLSLMFFDIDHFKSVNDKYGHLVGDDILRSVAQLAKQSLRKSDIIARWGGEEFIILLPNTSLSSATHLAEELRVIIQNEEFELIEHLTCSFGVAELEENESSEELLLRLDGLLYCAKANGRNRVEVR